MPPGTPGHPDKSTPTTWSADGKRILVTGGAGFLGSHLVEALVSVGAHVRVLDNLSTGRVENLDPVRHVVDFRVGDLRDANVVNAAVEGTQAIFHLGANSSVPASVENRLYDFDTNVVGTFHVIDAAINHNAPRIVFASSAAVYGQCLYSPVDENHPLNPSSPYGATKLSGERILSAYGEVFDIDVSIVRIFNTYGPRQRHYVMYDLMKKLAVDKTRLEVLGSGEQRRDYCYVADTVNALLLAAKLAKRPAEVLNIGGGRTVSIRQLVDLIIQTLRIDNVDVLYGRPSWKGDLEILSSDISHAQKLGWSPHMALEAGLREMAHELHLNL